MKTKIIVCTLLMLPVIAMINAYAAESGKVALPHIPRISAEELRQKIDKGEDIVVVDVRDGGSYAAGHIKSAINITYDATSDPMNRQMMLMALPMEKLVITYCDCTDDDSSAKIADELIQLGYEKDKVKILSGGSLRWVELKYPMVPSN